MDEEEEDEDMEEEKEEGVGVGFRGEVDARMRDKRRHKDNEDHRLLPD